MPAKGGSIGECDRIDANLGKSTMSYQLRVFLNLFSLQDVLTKNNGDHSQHLMAISGSNEVWKALKKLTAYFIAVLTIDPLYLGGPQKRRRIYIVLVHHTVARCDLKSHRCLQAAAQETLDRMLLKSPSYPDPFLGSMF